LRLIIFSIHMGIAYPEVTIHKKLFVDDRIRLSLFRGFLGPFGNGGEPLKVPFRPMKFAFWRFLFFTLFEKTLSTQKTPIGNPLNNIE